MPADERTPRAIANTGRAIREAADRGQDLVAVTTADLLAVHVAAQRWVRFSRRKVEQDRRHRTRAKQRAAAR